ncbi:hypothetical protein [Aeromonas sp. R2-2]|uniref:hypothetical protein n=1 Tax=Aeromonas sp. R2-2 TaxID=3138460 RepID=UPI0034A18FE8
MLKKTIFFAFLLMLTGCAKSPSLIAKDAMVNGKKQETHLNAPIDERCHKDFQVLRELNSVAYRAYYQQLDDIYKVYVLYKAEQQRMGKDPKELMSMELESKMNQVCSRVKYSVYVEVQKKLNKVIQL